MALPSIQSPRGRPGQGFFRLAERGSTFDPLRMSELSRLDERREIIRLPRLSFLDPSRRFAWEKIR